MAAMFGHTWLNQYGASPSGIGGDTWSAVLADLSGPQIAAGLHATSRLGSDWPPSAPRFRSLCIGIPTLAQVRLDLRPGNPQPMPFTRLLWEYLDGYNYRRAEADKADRMLREAYELARDYVMEQGRLPEPSLAIQAEAPPPLQTASPDAVRRHLDDIASTLGMVDAKTAAAGPDA